jgi:hypothetical protein
MPERIEMKFVLLRRKKKFIEKLFRNVCRYVYRNVFSNII